jgi:hypothetical protein
MPARLAPLPLLLLLLPPPPTGRRVAAKELSIFVATACCIAETQRAHVVRQSKDVARRSHAPAIKRLDNDRRRRRRRLRAATMNFKQRRAIDRRGRLKTAEAKLIDVFSPVGVPSGGKAHAFTIRAVQRIAVSRCMFVWGGGVEGWQTKSVRQQSKFNECWMIEKMIQSNGSTRQALDVAPPSERRPIDRPTDVTSKGSEIFEYHVASEN